MIINTKKKIITIEEIADETEEMALIEQIKEAVIEYKKALYSAFLPLLWGYSSKNP